MTRRALTTLTLTALLVLAASGPAAAATTVKAATSVEVEGLFAAGPYAVAGGSIDSGDARCLDNRRVAVKVIDKDGELIRFDVARTGKQGGWTAIHELTSIQSRAPLQAIKLKVGERRIQISKGKALVCKGKRLSVQLS